MIKSLLLLALIIGVGLAFRLPELDRRPMHNDEAVNAVNFTRPLWEKGVYTYDPNEYHGPSLHYAALPFLWLSPARQFSQVSETTLRLVPVFFGTGLILLLWWLRDGLGSAGAFFAGLLTAISPAMVFYSRYFIHEILLVFFTMLLLVSGWRYIQTRYIGWAILAGAGLGLMHATKETFVIPLAAMILALVLVCFWNQQTGSIDGSRKSTVAYILSACPPSHALAGLAAALVISIMFFTSFFTHPSGPVDSLRSYLPWLHRAGGHSAHVHPFGFYLERLAFFHHGGGPVWSEGLIVFLALVGGVAAFTGKGLGGANVWFVRFLAFYTTILTLLYSAISYKTPWCMLGFLHGMILLAGVEAVALVRIVALHRRWCAWAVSALGVAAAAQLGFQSWRASYLLESDHRNPYVYAQTVPDLLELVEQVSALAKLHPKGDQMLIKVMVPDSDYWPLPWYLRKFKNVGWWDQVPEDPAAPVVIVGNKLYPSVEKRLLKGWSVIGSGHGLRPEVLLQLFVRSELWQQYVQGMTKF